MFSRVCHVVRTAQHESRLNVSVLLTLSVLDSSINSVSLSGQYIPSRHQRNTYGHLAKQFYTIYVSHFGEERGSFYNYVHKIWDWSNWRDPVNADNNNRFLPMKTLSCSVRLQNSWKDFTLSFNRLANPPLMKMECSRKLESGEHQTPSLFCWGGKDISAVLRWCLVGFVILS